MDGHAESAPVESLSSLAEFLTDTPEDQESDAENKAADSPTDEDSETGDESAKSESDESEGDDESPDDEDAQKDQAPPKKYTVAVKGDDGEETTLEVDESELVKGYQRQADYTRKTQALAQRETEAVQLVQQRVAESRQHYLEQAQIARQAVMQLAGLRTPQEMAQLAQTDPAAWVQEQQRQQAIGQILGSIENSVKTESQRQAQEADAARQASVKAMFQQSWDRLQREGMTKEKLGRVFERVSKDYGFTAQEIGNVYDARIALMMRDAAAYRELQAKKPAVQAKVEKAPPMPSKNTPSRQERRVSETAKRFTGGRAKLNDLAAFLAGR